MKPHIALKIRLPVFGESKREEIETARDEWIEAYRALAKQDPSKKGLCDFLAGRIRLAAELFADRKKDATELLDGDFPLGNEADMALASPYFSVEELAMIQTGEADCIEPDQAWRKTEHIHVRKGFLAELKGLAKEAADHYCAHCSESRYPDDNVSVRYEAIRNRLSFEDDVRYLLEKASECKKNETDFDSLQSHFRSYGFVRRVAETEEEKSMIRTCALQIIDCYQSALERNYKRIKAYRKRGVTDFTAVDSWILTFDDSGNFTETSVVGIDESGAPIYADGCTEISISVKKSIIGDYRNGLKAKIKEFDLSPSEKSAWFDDDFDPYELLASAEGLKKSIRLGGDSNPCRNDDLSGLVGERLDAAAWQNYAIENGLVRPHTDYDELLDGLIKRLQAFLAYYEKAVGVI